MNISLKISDMTFDIQVFEIGGEDKDKGKYTFETVLKMEDRGYVLGGTRVKGLLPGTYDTYEDLKADVKTQLIRLSKI